MKTYIHTKTFIQMLKTVLFKITKNWNVPQQMNGNTSFAHPSNGAIGPTKQQKEMNSRILTVPKITLKGIMLRERNQSPKVSYWMIPFILHLGKGTTTAVENRTIVTKVWGWGTISLQMGSTREFSGWWDLSMSSLWGGYKNLHIC